METRTQYVMYVPTKTIFGAGSLGKLHEQVLPGKKALIVISNGKSARTNGYLERTQDELCKAGVDSVLFDKVEQNPLKDTVMAGAEVARENGCDFILALGGGRGHSSYGDKRWRLLGLYRFRFRREENVFQFSSACCSYHDDSRYGVGD